MDNRSYLLKNSYGIYHFRMVVPKRFRTALRLRKIKRSLHTKSHHQALRLARRYAVLLELLFEQQVITKADLSECLGKLDIATPTLVTPHLRRNYRIKTIQASLEIEGNTLIGSTKLATKLRNCSRHLPRSIV